MRPMRVNLGRVALRMAWVEVEWRSEGVDGRTAGWAKAWRSLLRGSAAGAGDVPLDDTHAGLLPSQPHKPPAQSKVATNILRTSVVLSSTFSISCPLDLTCKRTGFPCPFVWPGATKIASLMYRN